MKLRNKKTGEIRELIVREDDAKLYDDSGVFYKMVGSLAELNEEWEDYEPKEPLIKDEKIRKAVRAWAEANDIIKAFIVMNEHMNWTVYGDDIVRNRFSMEFFGRVVSENNETAQYSITELCGEEEE